MPMGPRSRGHFRVGLARALPDGALTKGSARFEKQRVTDEIATESRTLALMDGTG
jgi:hypothetical protein